MNVMMFCIDVDDVEIEWVSDILWSEGVLGIEEIEQTHGRTRLRSSFGLDSASTQDRLARLFGDLPLRERWFVTAVDPTVADSWKQFACPIEIPPDLVVVPAWSEAPPPDDSRTAIIIDPGTTFGMGDHPTTRGCLQMLRSVIRPGDSVADIGCGSGILGVTALVLGARRAVGLDINPAAVEVSMQNARRNRVDHLWSVTESGTDSLEGHFDVVVANILAPVLVDLAAELRRLMAPGGSLVISGMLSERYDHVLQALAPLRSIETITIDGWATVLLRS